ncbi:MAG: indolepyruvate oxidoreductase subunit beta family protein [Telluria sp.]|nr:indolepyruvate oxidoreductase subunit beta family protein [Telluria sp.]
MNTTDISFQRSGRAPKAITIAILAMGGEGGGVLADWMVDLAEHAGYFAQTTSVPGVAQRTGATIYYVEMFPPVAGRSAANGPVLGMMPTPGELDIVLASELMEAGRAVQRGLVTPDKTLLIASTHRVYSMTEKTAMGDGRVDAQRLIDAGQAAAQRFVHADFARLAEDNGSVISAALFGALAGAGKLPFTREQFEEAIRRGGVGIATSLAAFDAGFQVGERGPADVAVPPAAPAGAVGFRLQAQAQRIARDFPASVAALLVSGIKRMADYQDTAYATDYLDRLETIRELDLRHGDGSWRLLEACARYLALWMSYEDTIRVADLKTRRARFERVQQEVKAGQAQVVQINEFLHPRVEEIADTLPAGLGRWLLATGWARALVHRFAHKGRVVQTTSLRGYLLLYCVASLRGMRRGSLRFKAEHAKIAEWLAHIEALAGPDYALALEVAESQRLVKGYGDTHIRGTRNFDTIIAALPVLRAGGNAAARLRQWREAALADESGKQLAALMTARPA